MSQSEPNTIGILAGMGPRSTAPFVDQVVSECSRQYGARYDMEFPPMMILSLPTPYYADRPINHEEMEQAVVNGSRRLAETGIAFLSIPCNTVHIYLEQIRRAADVPVLDMIKLAAQVAAERGKRVAVLGTRATVESELYQRALAEEGAEAVWTEETQHDVDDLIVLVKDFAEEERLAARWTAISARAAAQKADVLLVASTDLTVAASVAKDSQLPAIDSGKVLAAETVRKWKESN